MPTCSLHLPWASQKSVTDREHSLSFPPKSLFEFSASQPLHLHLRNSPSLSLRASLFIRVAVLQCLSLCPVLSLSLPIPHLVCAFVSGMRESGSSPMLPFVPCSTRRPRRSDRQGPWEGGGGLVKKGHSSSGTRLRTTSLEWLSPPLLRGTVGNLKPEIVRPSPAWFQSPAEWVAKQRAVAR